MREINGRFKKGHSETVGRKNANWRGNKAGYTSVHDWLYIRLGTPRKCEHCSSIGKKKYEWANISKKYKRVLTDWIRLCTSCHRKYDGHAKKMWETRRHA